jgi:primary-amine oxidase
MTRLPIRPALALAAQLAAGPAFAHDGLHASHPLDGLTPNEIVAIRDIVKADGRFGAAPVFPYVTLEAPDKALVKAWKPGEAFPRKAFVNVIGGDAGPSELIVDLDAGKVETAAKASGQMMIIAEDWVNSTTSVLADPGVKAALEKRGVTQLMIDMGLIGTGPLTAGNFLTPGEQGHRYFKVSFSLKVDANSDSMPIEGLYAMYDLDTQKVFELIDIDDVPPRIEPWKLDAASLAALPGARALKAVEPKEEGAVGFTLDGASVNWDIWKFHWRVDARPGIILDNITVNDGKADRPVLYQANLSEVFVPYMDPHPGWFSRTYMDSGEYGFGLSLSPMLKGVDCPANAVFQSAYVAQANGDPLELPHAVCFFERSVGDPEWRKYNYAFTDGRPATEFVMRSASTVGNYDYLIDYIFMPTGELRIRVGATGTDATKGVRATDMEHEHAVEDTKYGTLLTSQLVAPNHDHFFNFRLDFDVDGTNNTFVRDVLAGETLPADSLRRSIWTVTTDTPQTELAAVSDVDSSKPTLFRFLSENGRNAVKNPTGYLLMPKDSYVHSLLDPADPPVQRNDYINHQIFITPYDPKELFAGGTYAMQSDGTDTLGKWVKQDRPIANSDIVAWYTVGFHHVPRAEDWPMMPTHWGEFSIFPYNFFDFNPAITIAPQTGE